MSLWELAVSQFNQVIKNEGSAACEHKHMNIALFG